MRRLERPRQALECTGDFRRVFQVGLGDPLALDRFASLQDPEGNPIQLWQPAGKGTPGRLKPNDTLMSFLATL